MLHLSNVYAAFFFGVVLDKVEWEVFLMQFH